MKFALFFAAVVFTSFQAQAKTACDGLVTCGTFEGPGTAVDDNGKEVDFFTDKLTVTSTSEKDALLVLTVLGKNPEPRVYELAMKFEADGRFTMTSKGHLYANGICKFDTCTYGMVPFKWEAEAETTANAGFMIFKKDGSVERHMLVVTPNGRFKQKSVLQPK